MNIRYKRTDKINGYPVPDNARTYEVWTQPKKGAKWVMRGWVDGGTMNQPNGPKPWMMLTVEQAELKDLGRWDKRRTTREEAVEWALKDK